MKIDVLYQFNEKYVPFAGVSITSLFENNKHMKSINVFILGENILPKSKNKFQLLAKAYGRKIIFVDTENLIQLIKKLNIPSYRGAYSANMRMFFPLVIKIESDVLLYLDSDTIVNGKLDDLINTDMGLNAVGMVLDSLGASIKGRIGLKKSDGYYNSGVILFNVTNWKNLRCTERIIKFSEQNRISFTSPDQDLLNIICKNCIKKLEPKYNVQPVHLAFAIKSYYRYYDDKAYYSPKVVSQSIEKPIIYHCYRFLGEFPWHKDNKHPNNEVFDVYLKISLWSDYIKKKEKVKGFILIEQILYRILPKNFFLMIFKVFHYLYLCGGNEIKTNRNSQK